MPQYNFVSPGAGGFNALEEFLMQRAMMERQRQEDEFKQRQAMTQAQQHAEQMKLQREQEARIAANQARQFDKEDAVLRQATNERGVRGMMADRLDQGPVSPGEAQTMSSMAYREGVPVPAVIAQALQPPKRTNVRTVDAKGNPVERAVTEDELVAGVPLYQEPKPTEPDNAPALAPAALDMAAKMYAKTGQLPPMGMGKQGTAVRQAIINRAAQYDQTTDAFGEGGPAPDIAGNKASYSADTQSLAQLTKNITAVSAFEETAKKNGQLLESILTKIPGQNTPRFLNTPLRGLATQFGSENMAQFNALRQSVQNEYARLVSQPGLSGVMSDSARQEMETILSNDASPAQIRAALSALYQEAENRKVSFTDQINTIKSRIRGGTTPATSATESSAVVKWGRDAQGRPVKVQ